MSPASTQDMSSTPSRPPSIRELSYINLQFFSRINRFWKSKRKIFKPVDLQLNQKCVQEMKKEAMDIHRENEDDHAVVLQRSVKKLHFGSSWDEKEKAAIEIKRLAREDIKTRKLMAELGVIPALVGMAASDVVGRRQAAVTALIELSIGTYTNKALMVEAGILSKLPKNIDILDESTRKSFAGLILSLSSVAHSQMRLPLVEILPFLIGILESPSCAYQTKEPCLGTLHNLSTIIENAGPLVSNGVVETLLRLCSWKELSEKSLATLGNLVATLMGKKALEGSQMVPECLIEILTWDDKPKCQELSAYILMILAHQSSTQRDKMSKAGIVPVLLEVALLGSPLAQKRALKLLQWFKDERQAKVGSHSGPQTGRVLIMGSPINKREAQEGKKMMRSLVKQSLYKNLEIITRRANTNWDSNKLKALVISTSSKSLPY